MENRFEISILLDYYGPLLTEKQLNIMNLYYNEDLSLAEIAELNNISRQAIYDLIKRCDKQLTAYEKKLNLVSKTEKRELLKEKLISKIKNDMIIDSEIINSIDRVIEDIINA